MGTASGSMQDEWERFFGYIFGDQTGWVYSPTKDPDTGNFQQYYFQWPEEKKSFYRHIELNKENREVYYGPALYANRGSEKVDFKGTQFVWCEFDGNAPDSVVDIPEPTLKVKSSVKGHEHWYWKLEGFIDDIAVVESISQKLAYHLGADLGSWNGNRVLRPVGTTNHKRKSEVVALRWDERPVSIADFVSLPKLPIQLLGEDDIRDVPLVLDVIAKYPWDSDNFNFFRETTIQEGHRSAALAKLGHICMEMGMSNAEALCLLYHADDRWGKFKDRSDRKKQLIGIINYCRARHPVNPIKEQVEAPKIPVFTFEEFKAIKLKLEWLVPDLLHKKGLFLVAGPPGVGKSQATLRAAEKFARADTWLKWKAERPIRSLFLSMEMPTEELLYFLDIMKMEDKDGQLRENFLISPLGHSIGLGDKKAQADLSRTVEKYQPDVIMMDSFGVAVGDELSSDKVILSTLEYVNKTLRGEFGAAVWFIHHPRKEQIGNKRPNKLDDLYGSRYISAAVTSAVNFWPTGDEIEVSCLKMRMVQQFKPFRIKRSVDIDFKIQAARVGRDVDIPLPADPSNDDFGLSGSI